MYRCIAWCFVVVFDISMYCLVLCDGVVVHWCGGVVVEGLSNTLDRFTGSSDIYYCGVCAINCKKCLLACVRSSTLGTRDDVLPGAFNATLGKDLFW